MITKDLYNTYVQILKDELRPAMGCTEPISIAYAAAEAKKILGDIPDKVEIEVSRNIIKNVKSVVVPHTGGMRGIQAAAAALHHIQQGAGAGPVVDNPQGVQGSGGRQPVSADRHMVNVAPEAHGNHFQLHPRQVIDHQAPPPFLLSSHRQQSFSHSSCSCASRFFTTI